VEVVKQCKDKRINHHAVESSSSLSTRHAAKRSRRLRPGWRAEPQMAAQPCVLGVAASCEQCKSCRGTLLCTAKQESRAKHGDKKCMRRRERALSCKRYPSRGDRSSSTAAAAAAPAIEMSACWVGTRRWSMFCAWLMWVVATQLVWGGGNTAPPCVSPLAALVVGAVMYV